MAVKSGRRSKDGVLLKVCDRKKNDFKLMIFYMLESSLCLTSIIRFLMIESVKPA